ncbi:hypothetical protein [Bradyrhizobium sp. B117]|uniref:hypothetical protein n=1 Tax=Bradyrhizobium sp. B117 TaxID=3140246 RepID=UPI003182FBED
MTNLYPILKGKAAQLARTLIDDRSEDLLALIMKDSDDPWQAPFLMHLPEHMPSEAHRQILLNGMAREDAGVDGWMAYMVREAEKD